MIFNLNTGGSGGSGASTYTEEDNSALGITVTIGG